MPCSFVRVAAAAVLGLFCAQTLQPAAAQQSPTAQPPQLPVFRAEAHFVRVDAYPSRDGKIVEGLTAGDFEILEDGKPQKIDLLQFIRFEGLTPDIERRDPNSQRDAFQLAADPRYRVFVIYLDMFHVDVAGSHRTRGPLTDMLKRILGPQDLFGMLTPLQMPRDLILGQLTLSIEEQLARHWTWGQGGRLSQDPIDIELEACGLPELVPRRQLDKVFADLEGLIALLGGLRQERKNILLFSDGWRLPARNQALLERRSSPPPIGVTTTGKLTLGGTDRGEPNAVWCQTELQRLANIDFQERLRFLVREARQANVTFYPATPGGLTMAGARLNESMRILAENTDGLAVVDTNDLGGGLKRIADDLAAYYVLGYYTTNTKWDGTIRKISVRLKPSGASVRARREYRAPTELEMAALRTPKPPAVAAGPSPIDAALGELSRLRPSAFVLAHGSAIGADLAVVAEIAAAPIEVGRWKNGGDIQVIVSNQAGDTVGTGNGRIEPGARGTIVRVPAAGGGPWQALVRLRSAGESDQFDRTTIVRAERGLLGNPLMFRATPAPNSPLRPVAAFQFRRSERIHADLAILKPLDRRDARMLDIKGQPLAVPVTLSERDVNGSPTLGLDLNLAPLTAGDYVIEITAGAGSATDLKMLAIRVVR